jgi:hypothetical protein
VAEFAARVSIVGVKDDPTDGVFLVASGSLSLSISGHVVGTWPVAETSLSRQGQRLLLSVEQESLVVEADDPDGLRQALSREAPAKASGSGVIEETDPMARSGRRGRHLAPRNESRSRGRRRAERRRPV